MSSGIAERLGRIRHRMERAAERSGRGPADAGLVAVSKTFPADAVAAAFDAGQLDFGESRQQEAAAKIAVLRGELRWHFIGKLQRNKVRKVLEDFRWIHSVDSLRLAETLERTAGEMGANPEILLEVNLAGETSKGGLSPDELRDVTKTVGGFSNVSLRGLMAIPPAVEDPEQSRPWFRRLRELRDELQSDLGVALPQLSMGMSNDFEVAIEEGATMVRVGSAIFGGREYA